jgi:hypothetical protein
LKGSCRLPKQTPSPQGAYFWCGGALLSGNGLNSFDSAFFSRCASICLITPARPDSLFDTTVRRLGESLPRERGPAHGASFLDKASEHRPSTDTSHIEQPSVQIYRDNDHWIVNSGQGQFEHKANLLRLQQNVVFQKLGDNPLQLTTESIQFEPDLDRVTIDSQVILQTRNSRIEAEAATFDLSGKVYSPQKTRAVYNNDES